jgi:hypothetical protein
MNPLSAGRGLRGAWLAAACAALLALSGCGGGVSIGVDGGGSNVIHIPDAFALRTASAGLTGGPSSLLAPSGALLAAVTTLQNTPPGFITETLDLSATCANAGSGGRLGYSAVDTNGDRVFSGSDTATFTFSNCLLASDGLAVTLNGQLQMTVQVRQAGLDTVTAFYFTPFGLQATLGGQTATYGGNVRIEYTFPGGNLNATPAIAYVSDRIDLLFANSRQDSITAMLWPVSTDGSGIVTALSPNHTLTLIDGNVSDVLTTSTLSPLRFNGSSNLFYAGQLRSVDGLDAVTTTVTGSDIASVAVDYNNDGFVDRIFNYTVRTLINGWN